MSDDNTEVNSGAASSSYTEDETETRFEKITDVLLGLGFFITAIVAFLRIRRQREQAGGGGGGGGGMAETTVVTAFYSLICLTASLRAVWFLVPSFVWSPSYAPGAVYAWDPEYPSWVGEALSELCVTAGSLTLFSIFILILVYWADILKKYFHPGARRSLPMITFRTLVGVLCFFELINVALFLIGVYTTEGMILFNAVLLAVVSTICVCEITIFSHRFRTVLKTLGAINQVSTDSQVRRIVWITVTGNLFFISRAIMELTFTLALFFYWRQNGTVSKTFSHTTWDIYTWVKYTSEIIILSLMLHILQSRFVRQTRGEEAADSGAGAAATAGSAGKDGYQPVPDAEPGTSLQV